MSCLRSRMERWTERYSRACLWWASVSSGDGDFASVRMAVTMDMDWDWLSFRIRSCSSWGLRV